MRPVITPIKLEVCVQSVLSKLQPEALTAVFVGKLFAETALPEIET